MSKKWRVAEEYYGPDGTWVEFKRWKDSCSDARDTEHATLDEVKDNILWRQERYARVSMDAGAVVDIVTPCIPRIKKSLSQWDGETDLKILRTDSGDKYYYEVTAIGKPRAGSSKTQGTEMEGCLFVGLLIMAVPMSLTAALAWIAY